MQEDKPRLIESHRTYDADTFRRRAGCVVLLPSSDDSPRRIILSSGKPGRYVVPGGGIDHGETPQQAALREVYEEAGVRSSVDAARFICWVENETKKTRTELYPESHLRTRICVTISEAEDLLAQSSHQLAVLHAVLRACPLEFQSPPCTPLNSNSEEQSTPLEASDSCPLKVPDLEPLMVSGLLTPQ